MLNSLYFKIKDSVDTEKHRALELFFRDWVDDNCTNQVLSKYKILQVDVDGEDAVALRLKGVPDEFRDYLEVIHRK